MTISQELCRKCTVPSESQTQDLLLFDTENLNKALVNVTDILDKEGITSHRGAEMFKEKSTAGNC